MMTGESSRVGKSIKGDLEAVFEHAYILIFSIACIVALNQVY